MLPTASEINDRMHGFTREDMDVLLWETAQMTPVAADDLRMSMIVQLRTHHRRYVDAITGRQKAYPDLTGMLVAELTRGWERYRIHAPTIGVRGVMPLQDFVEGLLGSDGVMPQEGKHREGD
jgi:hypothetical protein